MGPLDITLLQYAMGSRPVLGQARINQTWAGDSTSSCMKTSRGEFLQAWILPPLCSLNPTHLLDEKLLLKGPGDGNFHGSVAAVAAPTPAAASSNGAKRTNPRALIMM
mmetsp:Transcript_95096/g.198808  ORF Transcript_95096/g.198808 Transcript_95096/m.198808 type:complete len:108 (+) Transcript_95096:1241-1564(+)